jgi:hypothetical protein
MLKHLLAAAAAFALFATPVLACDDCKSCPHKKDTTAQADKKDEKGCHCGKEHEKCKCGEKCTCAHGKDKVEKKDETKKS